MATICSEQLMAFNRIYRELDNIYGSYATSRGISSTTLWLLYSIYTYKGHYTQRELCDELSYPPQTINSALKNMEKNGFVELVFATGNRKSKRIHFTPAGKELAEKLVAPLIQAEHTSFMSLNEEEQSNMFTIVGKHIALLKSKIFKI